MSALTHADIAEIVRRRYNGPDGDELRYIPLVDPAIRHLAFEVAANSQLRHWLLTDPANTTVTLANGVANLTTLIANPRIILECLKYGTIRPPVSSAYPTQPFRMINNEGQGQLKGMFDALQPKCWLEGAYLHTKNIAGMRMAGTITLEVPYWPSLAQLPESLVERLVHGNYWSGVIEKNAA